jgi:plastocyanin
VRRALALTASLGLAGPASLPASAAPPVAASAASSAVPRSAAAQRKRCGHRYRHHPPRQCRGRGGPSPKPPNGKPRPTPSPTPSAPTGNGGSGGGGSGGGPATPTAPGGGTSPGGGGGGTAPGGGGGGTAPAPLPSRLGVDETEYSVTPSYDPVAAGDLEFNVTNFGMDDHNLAIQDSGGRLVKVVDVPASQSRSFSVNLGAGTYKLFCSLYDHEQLGMRAKLSVR